MKFFYIALAFVFVMLCGCTTDERIIAAKKGADARVENFAKNQAIIHDGVREHWRKEAKAHVDTKHDWTLDKLETRAVKTNMTPEQIIADAKKTSDLRVKLYSDVDAIVDQDKQVEEYTKKDLNAWRSLNSKIDEYHKASSFNFFGLFGKGAAVEPPVVEQPATIEKTPEPPLKAETVRLP